MSENCDEYTIVEKCANKDDEVSNSEENSNNKDYFEKLAKLRLAISDVPGLRTPLDDDFLGRFLRTKKFVVEDAFKLYIQYWKTKAVSDDLLKVKFSDVTPSFYKEQLVVLPNKHNGASILYVRLGFWDPAVITIEQYIMSAFFLMEEITSSEMTQIHGVIIIVDSQDLSFKQFKNMMKQLSIRKIQTLVSVFQGGYPAKFKGFHVANAQYFWSILLRMVHPFLKEKLRKRIHVHGKDLTTLYKIISPSILPEELGGQLKSFEDTSVTNALFMKEKYYNDLSNFGFLKEKI